MDRKDKSEINLSQKTGKYFGVKLINYESFDDLEESDIEKKDKKINNKTEIKNKLDIDLDNNQNDKERENSLLLSKSIKSINENNIQNDNTNI